LYASINRTETFVVSDTGFFINGVFSDFPTLQNWIQDLNIIRGQSKTFYVLVTAWGGFSQDVSLGLTGLATPGITPNFTPPRVSLAESTTGISNLTITTTNATSTGFQYLTITGRAGNISTNYKNLLYLWISDFNISASTSTQTTEQGLSANYTADITSLTSFNETISLEVADLPPGATGTFKNNTITFKPIYNTNASETVSTTLTIETTNATPPETYHPTIIGRTAENLTRQTEITLTINPVLPEISVSVTPESTSVPQGQLVTFTANASGGKGNYEYQWFYISEGADAPLDEHSRQLQVSRNTIGRYYCNVTELGTTVKSNIVELIRNSRCFT
jgi:hypothetical protein